MEFSLYIFTNELLKQYIPMMNVQKKDILTVTGSGDQTLNLILEGAKSIDTYDINLYAKNYMYFKIANILCFSYEEFCDYYLADKINTTKYLNYYKRTRDFLPNDLLSFWDNNINSFINKEMIPWASGFNCGKTIDFQNNIYYNENKYYELKRKLNG